MRRAAVPLSEEMRVLLILVSSLLLTSARAEAPVKKRRADRVVVDTEERTIVLYRGKKEIGRYTAGFGSELAGKERRGDLRTPLGTYRLMKGRASKKFHRFLAISYPNTADAKRGLEAGLITKKQHDAIVKATRRRKMPPQNTKLGGAIGIHGYGKELAFLPVQIFHRFIDATEGCVIVSDDEVEAIEASVRPGAVIEIR